MFYLLQETHEEEVRRTSPFPDLCRGLEAIMADIPVNRVDELLALLTRIAVALEKKEN